MKVIFWNLRGASQSDRCVHGLAASEKPDLFALAEHAAFDDAKPPSGYHYTRLSKRLALLATTNVSIVSPTGPLRDFAKIIQTDGWSIAICHLKSPLNDGAAERNRHLRMLKAHLQSNVLFWTKLAVVGDLNLNPWEEPLVDKESLHGLQTRNEATQGLHYSGEHFPALLNESYQLARPFPAGTGEVWGTYKSKEEKLHSSLRWHILDQALVSPDVRATVTLRTELPSLPWYRGLGVKGTGSQYSDHLPIIVELNTL